MEGGHFCCFPTSACCCRSGCCCVHRACACACRVSVAGCDDVTHGATVVMTTAVGVASFVVGALAGAMAVVGICRRRPARYFVSRTTKTNVYGAAPSSAGSLPPPLPSSSDCGYSSLDADDVFLSVSPQHGMTVSEASLKRQLMLRSTESFRTMRTKLDSVDADDSGVM